MCSLQRFRRLAFGRCSVWERRWKNAKLARPKRSCFASSVPEWRSWKAAPMQNVAPQKSWKNSGFQSVHGGSTYRGKSLIRGPNGEVGPPPKKNIADLLK